LFGLQQYINTAYLDFFKVFDVIAKFLHRISEVPAQIQSCSY